MTSFVDVDFYKNNYLLGKKEVIPFSEFEYWARRATTYITERTQNRVELEEINRTIIENEIETEITVEIAKLEEVKMCTCEIAENYFEQGVKSMADRIQSQSVGGYSKTLANQKQEQNEFAIELRGVLFRWLSETVVDGTPIINRGNKHVSRRSN